MERSLGSLERSISLDDVIGVVATKRAPLAAELAGYIALEMASNAEVRDGELDPKNVILTEDGVLAIVHPRIAAAGDTVPSIRKLLTRLLEASGSTTPALSAVCAQHDDTSLALLFEEIEAALIPVNRAAGKRAMARLTREVRKVLAGVGRNAAWSSGERPSSLPPPSSLQPVSPPPEDTEWIAEASDEAPAAVIADAKTCEPDEPPDELKAAQEPSIPITFDEPLPPTERSSFSALLAQFEPGKTESELGEVRRDLKALAGLEPTPPPTAVRSSTPPPASTSVPTSRSSPAAPPVAPESRPHRGASALRWIMPFFALLAIGAYGAVAFRRGQQTAPPSNPSAARSTCTARIDVGDVAAGTSIFLYVGKAPADVRAPQGGALDFVATADGYSPKLASLKQDVAWERLPQGNTRAELAIQLERGTGEFPAPSGPPPAWATNTPRGAVHVVTTPTRADVWLRVGTSPRASFETACEAVEVGATGALGPMKRWVVRANEGPSGSVISTRVP